MQKLDDSSFKWFYFLLGVASLVIGYLRLWFGVDFLDEAWYVSSIQQFSFGGTPFVEEYSFQQMAFFIISPFFNIFYHGTDAPYTGSVLLVRHFYFIVVSITAFTSFTLFKRFARNDISFVLASFFFLDVFAIPSVSYNTIGRLGFFNGAALLAIAYLDIKKNSAWLSVLSGIALLISVLSYPPLVVPVFLLFSLAIAYGFYKSKQPRFSFIAASVFSAGLLCSLMFFYPLRSDLMLSLQMMKTTSAHAASFQAKLKVIGEILPLIGVPCALLFIYKRISHQSNLLFCSVVFLIFLFAMLGHDSPGFQYAIFLSYLAFFGLFLYIFFKNDFAENYFPLFVFVFLPVIAAGFTTALASANGYANICVGISPAAIISILFIHEKFKANFASEKYFLAVIFAASSIYITLLYTTIYNEKTVAQLTEQIKTGPYWGLFTTPDKAAFINLLSADLNRPEVRAKKTILSYYNFPAGYLFTPLRSNGYSTWVLSWFYSRPGFENLLNLVKIKQNKFFLDPENIADVIVRYHPNEVQYSGIPDGLKMYDPITDIVKKSNYRAVSSNALFEIYVKNDDPLRGK